MAGTDNAEVIKKAREDLRDLDILRTTPAFTSFFLRRVAEKIAARERKILDTATSPEETTLEKRIVDALRKDVLRLLAEDEAACRSVIGDEGEKLVG